jgi:hypothetical protein
VPGLAVVLIGEIGEQGLCALSGADTGMRIDRSSTSCPRAAEAFLLDLVMAQRSVIGNILVQMPLPKHMDANRSRLIDLEGRRHYTQ